MHVDKDSTSEQGAKAYLDPDSGAASTTCIYCRHLEHISRYFWTSMDLGRQGSAILFIRVNATYLPQGELDQRVSLPS